MAKAKPAKPSASKAKGAKAKAKAPARSKGGGLGGMMFKFLFLTTMIGLGYAAYTVPYHGHTMFERGVKYVEHEIDEHQRMAREEVPAPTVGKKPQDKTVADRRPAHTTHAPAEHISQSDKDALDRLIPH